MTDTYRTYINIKNVLNGTKFDLSRLCFNNSQSVVNRPYITLYIRGYL